MDAGIQEKLNDFIRRKGLRRTSQRDTIAKAAFSKDEHFTAEELFDRARKLDSETSRATVYRTLHQGQSQITDIRLMAWH